MKTNNGTDVAYVKGNTNTNENNQRMVGANTNGQLPLLRFTALQAELS